MNFWLDPGDSSLTIDHEGPTEHAGVQWPDCYTEQEIPLAVTGRWVRAELIPDTLQNEVPL